MARVTTSISAGIALVALALHAVALPALYYGLYLVVSRSHTELFVQHVRTISRNLAEELELGNAMDSTPLAMDMLDLAMLNGDGIYAELVDNGHAIQSTLNQPGVQWPGRQDFAFENADSNLYFIALPISRPGHVGSLRLGYDKRPTLEQTQIAMRRTFWVLVAYLVVALVVVVAWSRWLSRPVAQLQRIARKIASGDYAQSLRLKTGLRELHELGSDLESMRTALVGLAERLKIEMHEKERADTLRQALQARLRHRQRLETVGTLAGGIAHEFNNVLLPIVLFAESAQGLAGDNAAVRSDLEEILGQAYRAKEVVEKILMFSREADSPTLERIELEPVVREALRLFVALIPTSVTVSTDLAPNCPWVRADSALTVQMLMNLCTNAYQSLEGAAGTITVRLYPGSEPITKGDQAPRTNGVVLSVTDTGQGIEPAALDRIFEPFFTTRRTGTGTGLGLSVVHGIVENFGASISVETHLGNGTTFKVFFPSSSEPAAVPPLATMKIGDMS